MTGPPVLSRAPSGRRAAGLADADDGAGASVLLLVVLVDDLGVDDVLVLILGGLQFLPALALGPLAEHFALAAGKTF